MKKRNRKLLLTTFLAMATATLGAGVVSARSAGVFADNLVTAESVGFSMDKGAGVRIGAVDGNNGIRFVVTMDKSEYSALMNRVGTGLG